MPNARSTESDIIITPWKVLSSTIALNEQWFTVRKDVVELPSGKILNDYFVWESPSIATIVPVTEDGMFVVCEQYRHAVGRIMYQFPAGGFRAPETPESAACRELEEETGFVCETIEPLGRSAAYPTKLTGYHYLFIGKNAKLTGVQKYDEAEPVQVHLKTRDELLIMIENGAFEVADSLVAALLVLRR